MRTLPFLAVSLTSLMIAGPALADPSGFIAGSVGHYQANFGDIHLKGPSADLRGSATLALTPVLNIQGDVVLDYKKASRDDDDYHEDRQISGALHLFYREPERFVAGGFVQFDRQSVQITDGNVGLEPETSSRGVIGAEGQVFFDDLTLYGQAGYLRESFDDFDGAQSGFFATAELRYFLTPDFKINVHAFASRVVDEQFTEYSLTTTGIGAGAEYRLPESPISLFGSVDFKSGNYENISVAETRLMIGAKFNFGTDSLKDQDRNGTSLNPYPNHVIRPVPIP